MAGLGDVLEVIFCRPDQPTTVHAVIRERRNADIARQAEEATRRSYESKFSPVAMRLLTLAGGVAGLRNRRARNRHPPATPGPTAESVLEIWLDASRMARLERTWTGRDGTERHVSVVAPTGEQRSGSADDRSFDMRRGHTVAPGHWPAPSTTDTDRLFSHVLLRSILGCLELDSLGEGTIAERTVVRAAARERPGTNFWPHWLPPAEDYELAFDRTNGHLLAWAARINGQVFESAETQQVEYDGDLDPTLFVIPKPSPA